MMEKPILSSGFYTRIAITDLVTDLGGAKVRNLAEGWGKQKDRAVAGFKRAALDF